MNPRDIFERYRAERRGQSHPGFTVEVFPHLSRYTANHGGVQGFIVFTDLDPAHAGEQIDEQTRYFDERGAAFEWKVYDFDTPGALKALLEQRGFRCKEAEAFLVLPVEKWSGAANQAGTVSIEKITDECRLAEYVATEEAIWSEPFPKHLQKYIHQLRAAPEASSIYCAYVAGKPVATGRVEFPAESKFAELYGGGVLPAMRTRGIFSAMLSRRIAEAKTRGYPWITVDAAPMSRPILLGKGFTHVCWTYPMCREPVAG